MLLKFSIFEGTLRAFESVLGLRVGDRKFQDLAGVIKKYYDWGVSLLNGEYFVVRSSAGEYMI